MAFFKTVVASALALALGVAVLPSLASAQATPCPYNFSNTTTYCGTGTLEVYVQVLPPTGNYAYNPGTFTVQVSGINPSPASFVGSQNGTLVSLGAGAYSVAVLNTAANTYGYTPSYSQGCTGSIYNNSTASCVITVSPSNNYNPYPIPYPYPYTYPQLTCTPAYQTANLGATVSFTAQGGTGTAYNWSTPTQTYFNSGGPTFTTTLPQSGTQVVTVTNGNQTATCTVNVVATGGAVSYTGAPTITASYYPALPNTGFAPTNGFAFALAAVLLITAGIAVYPYVRKAVVVITR